MKQLAVTEAAAIKAYNEAGAEGKKMLANLYGEQVFNQDITERVKTIEDAFYLCGERMEDVISPSDDKQDRANKILKRVVKVLNEGTVLDFENEQQPKYRPWFKCVPGSGFALYDVYFTHTGTNVGAALCYKSDELARYGATQFIDVYNDWLS